MADLHRDRPAGEDGAAGAGSGQHESNEQPGLFDSTVDRGHDPNQRPTVQFDLQAGRRQRDRGTRQAEHGATAVHRRAGERALAELAATGEPFTSDTLHEHLTLTLKSNLVGALFRAAAARGLIEPIGYTQSARPSRHGGVVRVWRGTADG